MTSRFLFKALQELCEDPRQTILNSTKHSPSEIDIVQAQFLSITDSLNSKKNHQSFENEISGNIIRNSRGTSIATKDSTRPLSSSGGQNCSSQMECRENTNDNHQYARMRAYNQNRKKPHWVPPGISTGEPRVVRFASEREKEFGGMSLSSGTLANKGSCKSRKEASSWRFQNLSISEELIHSRQGIREGLSSNEGLHEISNLSLRELRQALGNVEIADNALNKADGNFPVEGRLNEPGNGGRIENELAAPIFSFKKRDSILRVYRFGANSYNSDIPINEEETQPKTQKAKFGILYIFIFLSFLIMYSTCILLLQFYTVEQKRKVWGDIGEWGSGGDETKNVFFFI